VITPILSNGVMSAYLNTSGTMAVDNERLNSSVINAAIKSATSGGAENAGLKMQDWKMQDQKMPDLKHIVFLLNHCRNSVF